MTLTGPTMCGPVETRISANSSPDDLPPGLLNDSGWSSKSQLYYLDDGVRSILIISSASIDCIEFSEHQPDLDRAQYARSLDRQW